MRSVTLVPEDEGGENIMCKVKRKSFDFIDRSKMLEKTGNKCACCGATLSLDTMTVDHFIPLSEGGGNDSENVIPMCRECNREKRSQVLNPELNLKFLKPEFMLEVKALYEDFMEVNKEVKGSGEKRNFGPIRKNPLHYNLMFLKSKLEYKEPDRILSGVPPEETKKSKKKFPTTRREVYWATYDSIKKRLEGYTFKRAKYSDLDNIYNFYVTYAEKKGFLDSVEKAKIKETLSYLFTNGGIFYAVDSNLDIVFCVGVDTISINGYIFLKFSDITVRYSRHIGMVFDCYIKNFISIFTTVVQQNSFLPFVFVAREEEMDVVEHLVASIGVTPLEFEEDGKTYFMLGSKGADIVRIPQKFDFGKSNMQKRLNCIYNGKLQKSKITKSDNLMSYKGRRLRYDVPEENKNRYPVKLRGF